MDHRACAFEIKIKDFEAKGFFRSEVISERSLRHLHRFNYVADARARKSALVHDAKALRQYFFTVRRLTSYVRSYYKHQETPDQTAPSDASVGSTLSHLAAAELQRALGQKRRDPFLRICAARHLRDRFVLEGAEAEAKLAKLRGVLREQEFHHDMYVRPYSPVS
jgi:hypothetical protein